jgi:hypothetical protein
MNGSLLRLVASISTVNKADGTTLEMVNSGSRQNFDEASPEAPMNDLCGISATPPGISSVRYLDTKFDPKKDVHRAFPLLKTHSIGLSASESET